MSFSYSGDPKTSKLDEVRFTIGDTETNDPQLQDEEINFALWQTNTSVISASILCCKAIVAKLSKQVTYKIGPETVDASDRCKQYALVLKQLEKDHQSNNAAPLADIPETPTAFGVGMHDNHNPY